MSSKSIFVKNESVSQTERWLNTLVPEFVEIESREIPDFIQFISDLSSTIHFYNDKNKSDGTWEDFFTSDPNILVLLLSRFDITKSQREFELRVANVLSSQEDEEKLLIENFRLLLLFIYDSAMNLNRIYEKILALPDNSILIHLKIDEKGFANEIAKLKFYSDQSFSALGVSNNLDFSQFAAMEADFVGENTFKEEDNFKTIIGQSLGYYKSIHENIHAKYSHLVLSSSNYIRKEKLTNKKYSPQIGLFVAFLDLFGNLRKRINGITRKHLDYYYRNVLGVSVKASKQDSVHLIFELDNSVKNKLITPKDLLQVVIPGIETPLFYKPINEINVSSVEVAEIKTFFLSDYPQLIPNDNSLQNVNEAQLYKADCPLFRPADFLKSDENQFSWPLLGEDQHDIPLSERTMEDGDIGLILASPILFQTEGERNFNLKFHLKNSGLVTLKKYIANIAQIKNKKEATIIYELLFDAFVLDYTTDEGFEPISKYTANISFSSEAVSILEINFKLNSGKRTAGIFDPLIHKCDIDTKFPVFRMRLNNFAEHHAYSFLKESNLERVTINIKVKGFKGLKAQNNIGPLSLNIAFQPFGPQPTVGSYLDLKNSNVFNRYTKDFSIAFEWLNLPVNQGGFSEYYASYRKNFSNDVFRCNLSSLHGGRYLPEQKSRQQFKLFESQTDNNRLKGTTVFEKIDFKKIEFVNKAGMMDEILNADSYFKEGAIRFEFISPEEGFGHNLFPQIFPEIMINNSKRFGKKMSLPNQPFIPTVKSVSIDYEVEYSENFMDNRIDDEMNCQLIHQYPFGYDKIFPDKKMGSYFFMPQYEDSGNLCIGLKNAEGGSTISLLFQVAEKNFHHTLHEPAPIKWSYLESNSWVEFKPKDVLSNSTNNFINSGIVVLNLPAEISSENTILNPSLFWLRASVKKANNFKMNFVAITTNVVKAMRVPPDDLNSPAFLKLKGGMIKEFKSKVLGIQNVWQPFPSFDGKSAESGDKYYVRVSERLRHKQRPFQNRDIIQVILEEFPEIFMVKCFGREQEKDMIIPGVDMHIVLIPKAVDRSRYLSKEPKVSFSSLYKVKSFLEPLVSPFIKFEVGNPIYESVKVICKVMFAPSEGNDYVFLTAKFVEDINCFLSPWLYEEASDLNIGTELFIADLQMHLNTLPYVHYLTGFSVVHFYKSVDVYNNEMLGEITDTYYNASDSISGSTNASILVPSVSHSIKVLNEQKHANAEHSGIGDFYIGGEFIVSNKYSNKSKNKEQSSPKSEKKKDMFSLIIPQNII